MVLKLYMYQKLKKMLQQLLQQHRQLQRRHLHLTLRSNFFFCTQKTAVRRGFFMPRFNQHANIKFSAIL
jgi:hypothetical protein